MLVAFAALALAVQARGDSVDLARAADRVLGARIDGLIGAAVVVVRGDSIVLAKGYGSAGSSGPVDPDRTLFRAASVGKLFVATAAMQLVQAGKLDLDRDIADYLPELGLKARGWPRVTMRQLLSHTAGIEDSFVGTIERVASTATSLADYFKRHPPTLGRAPGEQVNYSNLGVALGALVVERIAGIRFSEYVAKSIFEPLAMTHSTYEEPLPAASRALVAGDTTLMRYRLIPYPAGSLVTTASEMGRFVAAHLNDGTLGKARILDSAAVAVMHARIWSANPAMPGVALGFFESEIAGERVLYHTGSRGHHSALVLVPGRRFGFYAVLDAREGISSGILDELTQALLGARWEGRAASVTAQARIDPYVGRYRINMGSSRSFEKLAKLAMGDVLVTRDSSGLVLHREQAMPLVALDPDLFQTHDGMYVAFHRAADGSVDRMHASGRLFDGLSLDRVGVWGNSTLHRVALGGSFLAAWLVTLGTAVALLWRRIRRTAARVPRPWPRRLTQLAVALYALSPLPLVVTVLVGAQHGGATVVELAPVVQVVRGILAVAALVALGAALAVALGAGASRPYRWRDAAFAIAAAVVAAVLGYWRFLPY
ncbi:MAG TPA: serine hydrolase domain-containing protein [Gemmatimonadaceae bacterium]